MSTSLQEDIKYANEVIGGLSDETHRRVFGNTNERLLELFESIDITNKSVLAVMSSGDYLIMSHLFGAKSVECYDINPITYRYYYLKRWLNQNGSLDLENTCNYNKVINIINSVIPTSEIEKECKEFWQEIFKNFNDKDYSNNRLIITRTSFLIFYYIEMGDKIGQILSSVDPVFYNFDIRDKSGLGLDKKYDYVFISNILDCNNRDIETLSTIRQNLASILNKGGKVICTHLDCDSEDCYRFIDELEFERKAFEEDFSFQTIREYSSGMFYSYTLKNKD